ncbi:MAG: sulfur carrier protein ThiS [Ectothiorhodospiraceae bacterium]|jgi:thiamine biosynthesis protein ThiS
MTADAATIDIEVNGERRPLRDGATAADLVEELGLGGRRIAMEVNEDLLPRSRFTEYRLRAGDRVEIVQAIGGG